MSILSLVGGAASRWSARSRGLIRDGIRRRGPASGRVGVGSPRLSRGPATRRYRYHCRDRSPYTVAFAYICVPLQQANARSRSHIRPRESFSLRPRRAIFSPSSRASPHITFLPFAAPLIASESRAHDFLRALGHLLSYLEKRPLRDRR